MNIFRSEKLIKILPLLKDTCKHYFVHSSTATTTRDDCAFRVQRFSSLIVNPDVTQPQYWSGSPKIHKATETAFKWYLDSTSPSSTKKKQRCQCWIPSDKTVWIRACTMFKFVHEFTILSRWQGAQWLIGRVFDSRPSGRGFEPHRRHCVVVLEQDTFILA